MSDHSSDERIAHAKRLKWLCGEMAARLEETTNPTDFGNCGYSHCVEAEALSKILGFPSAPIIYKHEEFGPENPRELPVPFLAPGLVGQVRFIDSCMTTDPTGDSANLTIIRQVVEATVNGQPWRRDIWAHNDKTDAREQTIVFLKRWVRALDAILEGVWLQPSRASQPASAQSPETAKPSPLRPNAPAVEGIGPASERVSVATVRPDGDPEQIVTVEPPRPTNAVVMLDRGRKANVNGVEKDLNATQHAVVSALIKARPNGLTMSSLRKKSSQDALGILTRLRKKDADWAAVIHMAGAPYGRYRID